MKKFHQFPDFMMGFPGIGNLPGGFFADAVYFGEPFRKFFDNLQGLFLEMADQPISRFSADTLDHARF
jgi:hypothetical protein